MPGPVAVCPGADVLQPYYQDEAVTLYHGDSDGTRGGVPLLGQISERFDAIVTDPPYNASVTSTRAGQSGQRLRRRDGTAVKIWRDFGDWDHHWPPGPFLEHVGNLLTDNGSLIAFTTEHLLGDYMLSGLNHRCLGYWRKTNPTPAFRKLYVRAAEFFVWQVKGTGGWTFNAGGYQPNVFDGPAVSGFHSYREGARVHQTQKPLWLMRALIELHTAPGDLILDPYAGSGTTLVAAKFLGRRAVGIEQDEAHCERAVKPPRAGRPRLRGSALPRWLVVTALSPPFSYAGCR